MPPDMPMGGLWKEVVPLSTFQIPTLVHTVAPTPSP